MKNWLIEKSIGSDLDLNMSMMEIIVKNGGICSFVEILPFTNPPAIDYFNVMIYGSTKLINFVDKLKNGSVFYNNNFLADTWNHKHSKMLNSDACIYTLTNYIDYAKTLDKNINVFIRPVSGLKTFKGTKSTIGDIIDYKNSNIFGMSDINEKDTLISIASTKKIEMEWRTFIIDGKAITSSIYRKFNNLYIKRDEVFTLSSSLQLLIDEWLPHKNCVMDVALTQNGLKIIEFNCLNCSGFYDCDINNIVKALGELNEN